MHRRGSLSGIRVLDLSRLLPGPYCSMILADHGAEVIAVEDRRFQQDNLFIGAVNRNKRHLSLNLKTEEGREVFYGLARRADVVIEGFRPGVVQRLGVDYETIRRLNPRVVYCSISGYGQDGPYRDRAGHDVNYLSTAGVLALIGPQDGPPSIPGVQFADIAAGGMNAVIGILLALIARTGSGRGQYVDIAMTDGLLGFLSLPLHLSTISGARPQRSNELLSHRYACYNTYETADGRFIALGAVENRFWKRLCELLGVVEYTDLQYDDGRRDEIVARFRALFSSRTAAQWDELLDGHDVCYSRVLNLDEVMAQQLFAERQMVVDLTGQDGGTTKALGIPVKLNQTPGSIRRGPDRFGGSSPEILRELGYTPEQVADYRSRGII